MNVTPQGGSLGGYFRTPPRPGYGDEYSVRGEAIISQGWNQYAGLTVVLSKVYTPRECPTKIVNFKSSLKFYLLQTSSYNERTRAGTRATRR